MIVIGAVSWTEWIQPVIDEFLEMASSGRQFLPVFLQGLVLLLFLLILARVFRFVIRIACRRLKLDTVSEKVGLKDMLAKFGVSAPLSNVLAKVVFWMVTLYAFKATADVWKITDVSNFVNALILFLPKLLVTIFILFAGMLAADLVRMAIETVFQNHRIDHGSLIANFVYGLLAVMILTVVLGQLGIETELLISTVKILLAAFGLAVALALGLGLRPVARNVVSGVYARDLFPPGSTLLVEGDTPAVVREVGAVATRLETDGGLFIVIPNSVLVNQISRGQKNVPELAEKT